MRALRGRAHAEPLGAIGLGGTVALHAALVLLVLAGHATRARRPLSLAYRVELIAGAPAAAAPARPAAAAPNPAPAAAPAPVTPPPPRRGGGQPASAVRPETRSAAPARPTAPVSRQAAPPAAARAAPAPGAASAPGAPVTAPTPAPATAAPGAAPGAGADPATVRTEGVEFPFPGYLRNLVAQVYRRWHPPAGNAAIEAEVFFFVHRDGSVTGLQFVRRSGSFAFDLEAQGAVEAAARAGAFGALPPGYGPDVLPVSFFFSPRALR